MPKGHKRRVSSSNAISEVHGTTKRNRVDHTASPQISSNAKHRWGYLFRVQIASRKPPHVVRVLRVPADLTFHDFHMVLQAAFEWADEHAYSFDINTLADGSSHAESDDETGEFHSLDTETGEINYVERQKAFRLNVLGELPALASSKGESGEEQSAEEGPTESASNEGDSEDDSEDDDDEYDDDEESWSSSLSDGACLTKVMTLELKPPIQNYLPDEERSRDSRAWRLCQVYDDKELLAKGIQAVYSYDRGNNWIHNIFFLSEACATLAESMGVNHGRQQDVFCVAGEGRPAAEQFDCMQWDDLKVGTQLSRSAHKSLILT